MSMKKLIVLGVTALFLVVGCGASSSLYLKWGDVEYKSSGDHALKDLNVTRTTQDGTQITVQVGSSDSKEVQATLEAIGVLKDAVGKIPAIPNK